MMNYIKLFYDCMDTLEVLTDEETGRLFKALLRYAGGEEEQEDPPGREQIAYRLMKAQIKRDRDAYEKTSETNSENGKKGGRPKKTDVLTENNGKAGDFQKNQEKATVFFEKAVESDRFSKKSEESQDKDKDKDKDNPLYPPSAGLGGGGGGFLPEDEADALMADHQAVYDLAARAGFPRDEMTLDKLTALIADYTAPWVLRAIDDANAQGKASIAYLRGILDRYRRQGRPEDTRPQRPPADRPEDAYLFPVPQEVRTDPGKVKFT